MATKYCDHGAYGSGTCVASTSGSSTTLTIASTSAGMFGIGSELTGTGITAGTYVTALGTYNGSSGTVTMSAAMTVAASTAVTGVYGHPLATPTWAVPQEGDGTASTAATASAVTSIDMSGATAAATNTFIVMGATLTCVASGATVNNFNAGSGATLVANLVAAINRTTATATVAAQASGWATPKIQDVVFARVGSPTTTLEIMTRAGSATYNGLTALAWAGITGLSGTPTWSGGSGGCWGWFASGKGVVFPSSISWGTYGAYSGFVLAGFLSSAALGGSLVNVRSGKKIRVLSSSFPMATATANAAIPVVFKVDDSAIWSDGAEPVLWFVAESSFSGSMAFTFGGIYSELVGKIYPSGTYQIKVTPSAGVSTVTTGVNQRGYASGVDFNFSGAGKSVTLSWGFDAGTPNGAVFENIAVRHAMNVSFFGTSAALGAATIRNVIFDATGSTTANSRVFNMLSVHSSGMDMALYGVTMTGFLAGSKLFDPSDASNNISLVLSDVSWGNVTSRGPIIKAVPSGNFLYARHYTYFSSSTTKDFAINMGHGSCDWDSLAAYPTCNAKLLDGTTPWVIKVLQPLNSVANRYQPFNLPRVVKLNSLADGVRELKVEVAVEDTALAVVTTASVFFTCTYIGLDDKPVTVSSYNGEALQLTASASGTWSVESGGKAILNPGAVPHTKKQLSVTTPTAIKTGTEVSMMVSFGYASQTTAQTVFVDPEIQII